MNSSSPSIPEPIQPVSVRRHRVDWESGDPSDPTFRWLSDLSFRAIKALGRDIQQGCHFINPAVTVSCREPTAAFFREALNRRGSWLRTLRRALGNNDPRQVAKLLGPSARQTTLSGVMYIDGNPVPPRTWQARADELITPKADAYLVNITRRRLELAAFNATGDPEPLKLISQSALQEHLDRQPLHAAYVCPNVTVSAPSATPAFYEAVNRCQGQWCTLLNRTLGCGNVRRARRATDEATLSLVYSGTLVVDGRLYLPGCWPNRSPKPGRLRKTPFQAPTIPPDFLGLNPSTG